MKERRKDLESPLGKRRKNKAKGRLGRVFYLNFFVKYLLFLKISPYPSLKKRGKFFITFPAPF